MRLTSPDPEATLEIDLAHLIDPRDLEAICDGVTLINRLLATPPLIDALPPLPRPELTAGDRDAIRAWARSNVTTTHHPAGTCRMGPASDPTAIVDPAGRVYGIAGLRVADASIFPAGPRANIHAPVVAVAEKLADTLRSPRI
jgi:choline dehydrogenase-like flavoprotein